MFSLNSIYDEKKLLLFVICYGDASPLTPILSSPIVPPPFFLASFEAFSHFYSEVICNMCGLDPGLVVSDQKKRRVTAWCSDHLGLDLTPTMLCYDMFDSIMCLPTVILS